MTPEERVRVIDGNIGGKAVQVFYSGEWRQAGGTTPLGVALLARENIRASIAEAVAAERASVVPILRECRAAVDVLSEYAIKAGVFGVTKTRQGLYDMIDAITGNAPEEPTNAQ